MPFITTGALKGTWARLVCVKDPHACQALSKQATCDCSAWLARHTHTPAGKVQLILDWHHRMLAKGHNPANAFTDTMREVHRMYHQLKDTGALKTRDVQFLDQKLESWSIRQWEFKSIQRPEIRVTAPPPPRPVEAKPLTEVFQDVFDWLSQGHPTFERADFVADVYHQYKRKGVLTTNQERSVRNIAQLRAVRAWHAAHPRLKGTGVAPAVTEGDGYMFVSDDDDE